MGQTARNRSNPLAGRARAPWGGVVLAGIGVLASTVVTGCAGSLSAATTTLAGVVDARVVHSNGSVVAAVNGLRLRRGDLVRTGPSGRAELRTRGRVLYEGSDASVQLLDGARADLRHGALVVDAQHGPGIALSVAGLAVATPAGAAVRAERSVTVRIAALAGDTAVQSGTGRRLRVPALTQVVVGGDALPDSTSGSPLRLVDDDGEARSVPLLVRDDLGLNALAAGVDSTGDSTVRVVTAAWHAGVERVPSGLAGSEQVLPVVIAAASGGDVTAHYDEAVRLRREGASWGVVAHRLHTNAAAVLAALSAFEKGAATGQVGTVPAALAFLTGGSGTPGQPGGGTGRQGSQSPGGGSSSSSPRPNPSPSGSPDVVGGTIDRVLKLLPTPVPTPSSLLPVPVPSVPGTLPSLPSVGSLVTPAPVPLLSPH